MPRPLLYFNGIDGETGDYFLPPATVEEVAALAQRSTFAAENVVDAQFWRRQGEADKSAEAQENPQMPVAGEDPLRE